MMLHGLTNHLLSRHVLAAIFVFVILPGIARTQVSKQTIPSLDKSTSSSEIEEEGEIKEETIEPEDPTLLKPGDELWIIIPGPVAFDQKVVIDANGNVDLGFYGTPKVAGKSAKYAQETICSHLATYLRSTKGVHLKVHKRGKIILITGQVKNPGLTVVPDDADIFQALQRAGGADVGADLQRVALIRNGQEQIINLRSYLTRETTESPPQLAAGDTLFVPVDSGYPISQDGRVAFLSNKALDRKVFVLGSVRNPGVYDREPQMDPVVALGLAGGPADNSDLSNVRLLTKYGSTKVNLINILAGQTSNPESLPTDGAVILYVPFVTGEKDNPILTQINVIGGVQRPGRFSISDSIQLIDAIALAGGPTTDADFSDVRVVENGGGFTLATRYDLERYMERGGLAGRVKVRAGDTIIVDPQKLHIWREAIQLLSDLAIIATAVTLLITIGG